MFVFVQNVSTSILVGPVLTSGGVITSAMTSASSIVYQNGGLATTLSLTSVVYKTGGLYQIDLSSNAVANTGRIIIGIVPNTGYNAGGPIYGGVMPSTNQTFFYNAAYIPGILSSFAWNTETSRLLSSAAAAWSVAARTLTATPPSTWGPLDVWTYSSRTVTSGLTVAADVWNYSTRTLTSGIVVASNVWSAAARTLTSTPASTWGASDVWAYGIRTLSSAGVVWSQPVETTLTYENAIRGLTAAVLGNSTGGGTTAVIFRNVGSTVDRLTYDVTSVGNRTLTGFSW
jgi:hypothetical protein